MREVWVVYGRRVDRETAESFDTMTVFEDANMAKAHAYDLLSGEYSDVTLKRCEVTRKEEE